MAALSDLIAWRDSLREARYSGERRVRDSTGEEVEFKSDSELARALAAVNAEIAAATKSQPRTIHFRPNKGV